MEAQAEETHEDKEGHEPIRVSDGELEESDQGIFAAFKKRGTGLLRFPGHKKKDKKKEKENKNHNEAPQQTRSLENAPVRSMDTSDGRDKDREVIFHGQMKCKCRGDKEETTFALTATHFWIFKRGRFQPFVELDKVLAVLEDSKNEETEKQRHATNPLSHSKTSLLSPPPAANPRASRGHSRSLSQPLPDENQSTTGEDSTKEEDYLAEKALTPPVARNAPILEDGNSEVPDQIFLPFICLLSSM